MADDKENENGENAIKKLTLYVVIALVVGMLLGVAVEEGFEELFWDDDDEGDDDDEMSGLSIKFITDEPYTPAMDPTDFVSGVDNPYMPWTVGSRWTYEVDTEDGKEEIVVEVLDETKDVMGIECTVVRDTVTIDGELIEDTWDWYAQDIHGNVWYMGEYSEEWEDGELLGTAGSWEGGVDGAYPGIIMFADPIPGITYRQEYYKGEAEDMGIVISLGESRTVPCGTYDSLLKTKDFSPLEPDVFAYKYYAPGIGVVLEEEDGELVELVSFEEG